MCTWTAAIAAAGLVAAPAAAQNPREKPDNSWISVSGTVESVSPGRFKLDYGDDMITVEMDDGDRDADAYVLLEGDKVTVSGLIDNDLFEKRTIEASSVYVEKIGATFYASALDEEDAWSVVTTPIELTTAYLEGTVTSVGGDEFTLAYDLGETVEVETETMAYDPLDDEGYQKIAVGDRVRVSGDINYEFFEGRVFEADTIITLWDADMNAKN